MTPHEVGPGPPRLGTGLTHAGADVRKRAHVGCAKIWAMYRRLLSLLLMLCLATGAAARGCPMGLVVQAGAEASAQASMPDCPHVRAAATAQVETEDAASAEFSTGKTGCDHCKQCRVQVPPVEFLSLQAPLPPVHAPRLQRSLPPAPFSAPNLRPPISNSPALHA